MFVLVFLGVGKISHQCLDFNETFRKASLGESLQLRNLWSHQLTVGSPQMSTTVSFTDMEKFVVVLAGNQTPSTSCNKSMTKSDSKLSFLIKS